MPAKVTSHKTFCSLVTFNSSMVQSMDPQKSTIVSFEYMAAKEDCPTTEHLA